MGIRMAIGTAVTHDWKREIQRTDCLGLGTTQSGWGIRFGSVTGRTGNPTMGTIAGETSHGLMVKLGRPLFGAMTFGTVRAKSTPVGIGFLVALYTWDMALKWLVGSMARFTGDSLMRSLERKGLMLPVFSNLLEGLEDGMALGAILSTLTLVFVRMAVSTGEGVRSI